MTDVNYTNLGRHNSTHAPHNSTHAPTSPSLLNTHEISYPHPTPTPLHHTQNACPCSCLQVCCQSINLKMAIRAETCSWYLCNKQHISNHRQLINSIIVCFLILPGLLNLTLESIEFPLLNRIKTRPPNLGILYEDYRTATVALTDAISAN
jgi:hypothetical protein